MKLLVSILCLTFFTVVSAKPSILIDSVKNGNVRVYSYQWDEDVKQNDKTSFAKYKFNVDITKGAEGYSFVVDPRDVHYESNHDDLKVKLEKKDVEAIELPMRIHLDSKDVVQTVDFDEADTTKSLDIKDSVVDLLNANFEGFYAQAKEYLKDTDSYTKKEVEKRTPIGVCKTTITYEKKDKYYKVKVHAKREECTGTVEYYILRMLTAKSLSTDSEYNAIYYIEKETSYPNGAHEVFYGKDGEGKTEYKFEQSIRFVESKEVDHQVKEEHFKKHLSRKEFDALLEIEV